MTAAERDEILLSLIRDELLMIQGCLKKIAAFARCHMGDT